MIDVFYYIDLTCLWIFLTELIFRGVAEFWDYFSGYLELFDAIVVIVSLVFAMIKFEVKGVAVLRLLRLVRGIIALRKISEHKKKLLLI